MPVARAAVWRQAGERCAAAPRRAAPRRAALPAARMQRRRGTHSRFFECGLESLQPANLNPRGAPAITGAFV